MGCNPRKARIEAANPVLHRRLRISREQLPKHPAAFVYGGAMRNRYIERPLLKIVRNGERDVFPPAEAGFEEGEHVD